jgi:hypothetical protein
MPRHLGAAHRIGRPAIGKVEIRRDQRSGNIALGFEVVDHAADLLDDIGLDARSRFVHQQDARFHDHGARYGPADVVPVPWGLGSKHVSTAHLHPKGYRVQVIK